MIWRASLADLSAALASLSAACLSEVDLSPHQRFMESRRSVGHEGRHYLFNTNIHTSESGRSRVKKEKLVYEYWWVCDAAESRAPEFDV